VLPCSQGQAGKGPHAPAACASANVAYACPDKLMNLSEKFERCGVIIKLLWPEIVAEAPKKSSAA
jgi:hypothetical protein